MRLLSRIVPHGLEGTAQAIYGTVGIGAATALLTRLRRALRPSGVPRVLGHGWLVCVCLPADLEAEVIGVRGKPYSLCSSIQQANHACERSPPKILSLVNASRFRSGASCRRLIGVWHEGTSVRWLS